MASTPDTARKVTGLGFLPDEARHGFLVDIPKGSAADAMICITEHRGDDLDSLGARTVAPPSPNDPALRVIIDRARWLALAPALWDEANRRLRANGLPVAKFPKNPAKPVPVHPSLGKELCVLCWAVENAPADDIPNALKNWEALEPEERWWLYTMTVATTGQALAGAGRYAQRWRTTRSWRVRDFHPRRGASFWGMGSCPWPCRHDSLQRRLQSLSDIKVMFPADALAFMENWYEQ